MHGKYQDFVGISQCPSTNPFHLQYHFQYTTFRSTITFNSVVFKQAVRCQQNLDIYLPIYNLTWEVISPMLFNIYIPNELSTVTCKYADDCSQYELVSIGQNSKVPEAVNFLKDWAIQNKMELNTDKTKDMWIRFSRSCPAPPNISI